MRSFIIFACVCTFAVCASFGQVISMANEGTVVEYRVENNDTVYYVHLKNIVVRAPRTFKSDSERKQYYRLVYNVKKVYPYASLAGVKLGELNEHYLSLETDKERKAYGKKVEEELKSEFESELRKLTITQGRILLRLVDRETGNTTYEILKEFRGSMSAFFWQTIARVFGSNLKSTYDPAKGEDKTIEQIIMQIEEGSI